MNEGIPGAPEPAAPDHLATYQKIREMILFGDLAPGQPVTIHGMTAATSAGMTPVREAIRRLTAEGALEALENRRVCVPLMTAAAFDEILYARQAIEPRLAGLAASRIDAHGVERLEQLDAEVDEAIARGDARSYLRHNYLFHFAIYEAARTEVLVRIVGSLWLRMGPALRVVCGRYGTSNLPDRHKDAVAALRAGDADAATTALQRDIGEGAGLVREALTADGGGDEAPAPAAARLTASEI